MSDRDAILADFQSCTGIEDPSIALDHLERCEWDLLAAIQRVTSNESQRLPSEMEVEYTPNEEVNLPIPPMNVEESSSANNNASGSSSGTQANDVQNVSSESNYFSPEILTDIQELRRNRFPVPAPRTSVIDHRSYSGIRGVNSNFTPGAANHSMMMTNSAPSYSMANTAPKFTATTSRISPIQESSVAVPSSSGGKEGLNVNFNGTRMTPNHHMAGSSSNSFGMTVRKIQFEVHMNDDQTTTTFRELLNENETVLVLKRLIETKFEIPPEMQILVGWPYNHPENDNTSFATMQLPSVVYLELFRSDKNDTPTEYGATSGIQYKLHITDETSSKEYNLNYMANRRISEIKNDLYHLTDIPVSRQIWTGWPTVAQGNDNLYLIDAKLTYPVHHLTVSAAPLVTRERTDSSKVTNLVSDSDSENNYSEDSDQELYDPVEEEAELPIQPQVTRLQQRSRSLLPAEFQNETVASVHFSDEFANRYGASHPHFYQGTLEEAMNEALLKPVRERKLLAIYLHEDTSVLTNVFCTQLLCFESVKDYLANSYILWGWDLTLERNKNYFLQIIAHLMGTQAAASISSLRTEVMPALVIVTRVRGNTEILNIINGNNTVNELLSNLIHSVDLFNEQQSVDIKEEVDRGKRERIKIEQDDAYQRSLATDRAKLEAKRKQEEMEQAELEKEKDEREKKEAKRVADRMYLESTLPAEPEEGAEGITKIKFRLPQSKIIERRFNMSDTIQTLLNFLKVKGYDGARIRLYCGWPKVDLMTYDMNRTLSDSKFCPQETVILEEY